MGTLAAFVGLIQWWEVDSASPVVVLYCLAGLAGVYAWGLAQQLVMQSRWPDADSWALTFPASLLLGASTSFFLGLMLAFVVIEVADFAIGPIGYTLERMLGIGSIAAMFGGGVGLLQALYFSNCRRKILTWITASSLAYAAGIIVLIVIGEFAGETSQRHSALRGALFAGTAAGAVYGIFTGGALMLMLRKPPAATAGNEP